MKNSFNRRRWVAGIFSLCMLGAAAGLLPESPLSAAALLAGDVTCDNAVSAADAVLLSRFLVQKETNLSDDAFLNADLNADQIVDAFDLLALKRTLLTASTDPPVDPPEEGEASITLAVSTLTVAGAGVTQTSDTVATITAPGEYNVYGEMTGGQIVVDVDKTAYPDGEVSLILNGISLTNTTDSPIYIASVGGECSITAKKDTESVISDGESYENADGDAGAIYSKDDLKFKGKGKLTVIGNCADGIVCKNDLKLWNGTLVVNAADDAIRGKDSVRVGDPDNTDFADLNITVNAAGGDGFKATDTDITSGKGFITVTGGTLNVTAYSDGFHATQQLNINGGDITVTTTCPATSSGGGGGMWGGAGSTTTVVSAKGLKAGFNDDTTTDAVEGTLNINGGTLNLITTDDGIHATNVNITGGVITVDTGDDGVHADETLIISGGDLHVVKSYEGIEAADIQVQDGTIHVNATDDGFNAAGGNDGSGNENPGGWWPGGMSSSSGTLTISGGYMYVRAEGDVVDSNGNLTISGGTVIACGPTRGGNGIFDKGDGGSYSMSFTGGTVFGMGTSDMMETPNATGGSYVSAKGVSLQPGNLFSAADANGNVVAVLTVPADISITGAIQFYSTEATGETMLYSGGSYDGTLNEDGYATGGSISGATAVTSSGDSGQTPWSPWG